MYDVIVTCRYSTVVPRTINSAIGTHHGGGATPTPLLLPGNGGDITPFQAPTFFL
jgi:hypothetical protein